MNTVVPNSMICMMDKAPGMPLGPAWPLPGPSIYFVNNKHRRFV